MSNVVQSYPQATSLRLPDVRLDKGEHALLLGPSGSGKTTVLHVAAGLIRPRSGSVRIGGVDLVALGNAARDRFRGRHVGIVFQNLHLIPSLTALQNLLAAQFAARLPQDRSAVMALLDRLGLATKAGALPATMSQGQMQRLAIARALVNKPQLVVADEPTSSLDDANATVVLDLLRDQAYDCGAMLLIATHDARAKAAVARHIEVATVPGETP